MLETRAQSAMEYLITHAWMIIVIGIVLAVLFSLGIFSPSTFAPKAQPGSCQVVRSSAQEVSLAGVCNNNLPEFVAVIAQNAWVYVPLNSFPYSNYPYNAFTITFWVSNWQNVGQFGSESVHINSVTEIAPGCCAGMEFSSGQAAVATPAGQTYVGTAHMGYHWTFYAITLDGSTGRAAVYTNGTLTANAINANYVGYGGINYLNIGSYNKGLDFSPGNYSNVQLYNTSLNAQDVYTIYHEGIGGHPINLENLVSWLPLNGDAKDYSGNGNDGIPTNVAWGTTWQSSGYTQP